VTTVVVAVSTLVTAEVADAAVVRDFTERHQYSLRSGPAEASTRLAGFGCLGWRALVRAANDRVPDLAELVDL
jgi:hypothetical protein